MKSAGDMPLTMLAPGHRARVSEVRESGRGIKRRLTAMGIAPGVEISVLASQGGPVLLRVGQNRIAIGRGMAHRVMVTPLAQP